MRDEADEVEPSGLRVYAYFKRTVEEIPYLTDKRDAVQPTSFGQRPSGAG